LTRAIFDRYNIVSENDLRAAVKKTNAYLNSAPKQREQLITSIITTDAVRELHLKKDRTAVALIKSTEIMTILP